MLKTLIAASLPRGTYIIPIVAGGCDLVNPDWTVLQLNLSGITLKSEDLFFLGELQELTSLLIADCAIDDAALPLIGRVAKLEQLCLTNSDISGRELGALASCTELRDLVLDDTQLTETLADDLAPLRHLQLRVLSIGNCGLSEDCIVAVERLLPFTEVSRKPVMPDAEIPRWMPDSQSIRRSRDARESLWSVIGQVVPYRCSTENSDRGCLELISLADLRQPVDGLAVFLANLGTLKVIDLSNTPATSACIRELRRLPHLESFNCSRTQIDDTAVDDLVQLPSLRELDLSRTQCTDAGVARLARKTALEQLWLCHTLVTDAGVGHLAELPNLTHLSVAGCSVTDASEQHFLRMKVLRELCICGTRVTPEMVQRLGKARPELILDVEVFANVPAQFELPVSASDEERPGGGCSSESADGER